MKVVVLDKRKCMLLQKTLTDKFKKVKILYPLILARSQETEPDDCEVLSEW